MHQSYIGHILLIEKILVTISERKKPQDRRIDKLASVLILFID